MSAQETKGKDKAVEMVPMGVYQELVNKMQALEVENDAYRQKAPLVGIRWYGQGGYGIGLSQPINGQTRVSLDGFGDKAVIDLSTWNRIKRSEMADYGLVVRDDAVIDELYVVGNVAPPDKQEPSVNSYTEAEATELLKGKLPPLKKAVAEFDSHWAPIRFLLAAKELEIEHTGKLAILRERRDELLCEFRWRNLHPRDLYQAGENPAYEIPDASRMQPADLAAALAKKEIQMLRQGNMQ